MVDAADIKDRDTLEAWLKEQPREVAVWIAARAAARVLPVWWWVSVARSAESSALPMLRCLIVSLQSAYFSNDEICSFAEAAARAGAAEAKAADTSNIAHPDTVRSAYAAARAAHAAGKIRAGTTSAIRTGHVVGEAFRAFRKNLFWQAISFDADIVEELDIKDFWALWPDGLNPFEEKIREIEELSRDNGWDFWIAWYQSLLYGTPMLGDAARTWEMLERIARIKPETWDKGPDTVNPLIAGIWEEYQLDRVIANNPLALRIERNKRTGKLESFPAEQCDLSEIVKAIRLALREFIARCKKDKGSSNFGPSLLNAFEGEIVDLRRDVRKYKNDPRQLFRVLEETRRSMRLIADTEGFGRDPNVDRLLGNLERQSEDICAAAPEVLEEVKRRLSVRVQLFKSEQTMAAMRMSAGMYADSSGLLRAVTAHAMSVVLDEARAEEEKQAAWTFLLGALPRGAREMRSDGEDGAKAGDDPSVIDAVVSYADKAAKIDKGVDALQEAVEEGGPWAAELVSQITSGNLWGWG